MDEIFDLKTELTKLCKNGWLSEEEVKNFSKDEGIIECINKCNSPNKQENLIFNAFRNLNIKDVKAVIIGQDPYPDSNKAHGMAFSYNYKNNAKPTDSLKNIFNQLNLDTERTNTDLTKWKEQGVLLLNTALTFRKITEDEIKKNNLTTKKQVTNAQQKIQTYHINSWKPFIISIIHNLINCYNAKTQPLVIFLWGEKAQKMVFELFSSFDENKINIDKNATFDKNNFISQQGQLSYIKLKYQEKPILLLQCSHPSNLSYKKTCLPFFTQASKQFKQCNEFLKANGETAIDWCNI